MKMRSLFSHYGHYLLLSYTLELLLLSSGVVGKTESEQWKFAEQLSKGSGSGAYAPDTLPHHPEAINNDPNDTQLMRDTDIIKHDPKRCKNYASAQCAQVIETNPEARNAHYIVNKDADEYMLTPCDAKIWFVIELCETIQATHIMIGNYELFSSMPKEFTVYFSDTYPTLDWKLVGEFTANNSRTLQTFDLELIGFGKFIRVDLRSHYGEEYYCPISEVRVHGHSMVDEYERSNYLFDTNSTLKSIKTTVEGALIQDNTNLVDVTQTIETQPKPKSNKTSSNKITTEQLVEKNLKTNNKTAGPVKLRRTKSKISNHRVYQSLMTEPFVCGLSRRSLEKNDYKVRIPKKEQQQPAPATQAPVVSNKTTPLKPSVFVELSNKVKALETSLKEEMDRRLNDTETKYEELRLELRTSAWRIGMIVISYCVYKLLLEYF